MDPGFNLGDLFLVGSGTLICSVCLASGRFDETLLFLLTCLVFCCVVTAKLPSLGVAYTLRPGSRVDYERDTVAAVKKYFNSPELDNDLDCVLFSVVVLLSALCLFILAQRTLNRYSPALCVVLYCSCASMLMNEKAVENWAVLSVILVCMASLSLASNHILRLHIASSIFCCCLAVVNALGQIPNSVWDLSIDLTNPRTVSLSLSVGLGACIVHDVLVRFVLDTLVGLIQLVYVLSTALVTVDLLTDLGCALPIVFKYFEENLCRSNRRSLMTLTWTEAWERLNAPFDYDGDNFSSLYVLAPSFCVVYAVTMVMRRLIAPTVVWREDRFKEAVGTLAGVAAAIGLLVTVIGNDQVRKVGTNPAVLAVVMAAVYLQIWRMTNSSRRLVKDGTWLTMVYWRNAFPQEIGELYDKVQNSARESPPFVLEAKDDDRVKEDLRILEEKKRRRIFLAQEVTQTETLALQASTDKDLWDKAVTAHLALAKHSIENAEVAEQVAKQMRELACDAETEVDVLKRVRTHTLKQDTKHAHHMVIKRQTVNALATFSSLSLELQDAEVRADTLRNLASKDIYNAMLCLANTHVLGVFEQERVSEKLIELAASAHSFFAYSQIESTYKFALRKLKGSSSSSEGSNQTDSNEIYPKRSVPTALEVTPYQMAMMSKHGPTILAADEDDSSTASLDAQQGSKKRWKLFPFSRSKKNKGSRISLKSKK